MSSLLKSSSWLNPYVVGFLLIYGLNLVLAQQWESFEIGDAIGVLLIFGIGLTSIAWGLSRKATFLTEAKPQQSGEVYVLLALVAYLSVAIVLGNKALFVPENIDGVQKEIATIFRKVLTFVIIPFFMYRWRYRFIAEDFGLSFQWKKVFSSPYLLIFVVMSTFVILLNYNMGTGAKPIREGAFSAQQLMLGLPLFFLWLFIEVGLVEEFFFRGLLQNRLAVWLKSNAGAICISALVFGLVHAPGMYLRGAGVEDGLGAAPSLLASIGYCIAVQSIPGLMFGILWWKTRNLWLLMGIHAAVDLLPNFPEFVKTWGL